MPPAFNLSQDQTLQFKSYRLLAEQPIPCSTLRLRNFEDASSKWLAVASHRRSTHTNYLMLFVKERSRFCGPEKRKDTAFSEYVKCLVGGLGHLEGEARILLAVALPSSPPPKPLRTIEPPGEEGAHSTGGTGGVKRPRRSPHSAQRHPCEPPLADLDEVRRPGCERDGLVFNALVVDAHPTLLHEAQPFGRTGHEAGRLENARYR